jgi:hypothetical protein
LKSVSKSSFDFRARMKCPEDRDRCDRGSCQLGRDVGGNGEKSKDAKIELLAGCAHFFELVPIEQPKSEIERVPRYSLVDDARLPRDLVANCGADEIGSIGVKSLINEKIDLPEINVPEVDRYLL